MKRTKLLALGVLSAILLGGCGADLNIDISSDKATINKTTYFTPAEAEYMTDPDLQLKEVERNGVIYYATTDSKTYTKDEFADQDMGVFTDKYIVLTTSNKLDFYDATVKTPFKITAGNGTITGDNSIKFDYATSFGGRPKTDMQQIYYAVADESLLHGKDLTITGVKNSGMYKKEKTIKYTSSDGIVQSISVKKNGKTTYENPTTGSLSLYSTGKYEVGFTLIGGETKKMTVWIDQDKPKANVSNKGIYTQGKVLTFSDKGTGLKSAKLDGKTVKSGKKLTKTGSHKLVLTDKAGNKTTVRFTVKK